MGSEYKTETIDHLGIVAGICDQIGLVEVIDAAIADTGRKVTVGQAVKAMVLNGLGFTGRPLYLTPEFFQNRAVEHLIGEGIEAEDVNSDSLSKAMDALVKKGLTELFSMISSRALKVFGIQVKASHLDTSSFSLEGVYDREEVLEGEDEEIEVIRITHGYSKDHRPDLKQAILSLICANQSSIPVYLSVLSGNTSDKASLPQIAEDYLTAFGAEEETPIMVVDSALYGAGSLEKLKDFTWLTRVPATLNEAQHWLENIPVEKMTPSEREHFSLYEGTSHYGDIEQRWLLVHYQPRRDQELLQLEKRIGQEGEDLKKKLKKLEAQEFNCEQDALSALERFKGTWRFHQIEGHAFSEDHYAQAGRPTAESPKVVRWRLALTFQRDDVRILQAQKPFGKYLIATNVLDPDHLSAEGMLTLYKDQNVSVERGFRFLKDPLFFAQRFFLKKPSRIMALLMIMGISLLVYSLAEYQLRQQLALRGDTLPDQKGRPTQTPTMRRIFQVFEGIHLLTISEHGQRKRLFMNLTDLHLRIAELLGESVLKFYTFA